MSDDSTAGFQNRLSRIRHDLRTPVGHIIGYAEILQEDIGHGMPAEFVRDLHAIRSSGERLVSLIDDHFSSARTDAVGIDLVDARYRLSVQAGQIAGYAEVLREHALESGREEFIADLDKIVTAAGALNDFIARCLVPSVFSEFLSPARTEPATNVEQAAIDLPPSLSQSRTGWLAEGGKLLVVDDDASNRDLISRRLTRYGYETTVAESGEAALALVATTPFDAILLDVLMPGLSGIETLERLKLDPKTRSVPVIMLSAADNMDMMVQCVLKGADDYLFKPFNPILLRARIGAALEKVRLRQQFARRIKVFISSPGDVIPERRVAKQVINLLNEEYSGEANLVPILWEEEPLLASETFQSQIHPPSEADIYVGILWSRIGSPLPESICRADGSRYESGTTFEFEDAMAAFRRFGKPDILVYRKTGAPTVSLHDRAAVLESLEQMDNLRAYLDRWFRGPDGTYSGAFHEFSNSDQFEVMLATHLRKLVDKAVKQA